MRRLVAILAAFAALLAAPVAAQAPRHWSRPAAEALLGLIAGSVKEGLSPADYGPDAVEQALAAGEGGALDGAADAAALALARDYYEGHRRGAERSDWHIPRGRIDYGPWLDEVLARNSIAASYARLLPDAPAYAALRDALARCHEDCATIAANMDRWRALPRHLGGRYLWVNVPAYRLDLIEDGQVVSSHRIIVGKPGSRTPIFRAAVTGVTINPWWNVPCSIVDESIGKLIRTKPQEAARRGYVATRDAKGVLHVRQKPGPDNALGRIKLEMPNPYSVFIHDTPSTQLFDRDTRALSHGCIRTEAPADLARALLGPDRAGEVQMLLASGVTRTLALSPPLPVYVVYLTAEPDPQAPGGITRYPDIYGRDTL